MLGQPSNKSDAPVKLVTSCCKRVETFGQAVRTQLVHSFLTELLHACCPMFSCRQIILDLQPISRELLDNVARPLLRLMLTIELIKYSFVPHHRHGRRASQELVFKHYNIMQ